MKRRAIIVGMLMALVGCTGTSQGSAVPDGDDATPSADADDRGAAEPDEPTGAPKGNAPPTDPPPPTVPCSADASDVLVAGTVHRATIDDTDTETIMFLGGPQCEVCTSGRNAPAPQTSLRRDHQPWRSAWSSNKRELVYIFLRAEDGALDRVQYVFDVKSGALARLASYDDHFRMTLTSVPASEVGAFTCK